ncbi:hypothetical protein ACSTIY_00265, partial [Vibrio parahaemolyticus]
LPEDAGLEFHPALYVATRVASVQSAAARRYVTLDAGSKALAIDAPGPRLRTRSAGTYEFAGDEHGRWRLPAAAPLPERGARIDLVP